MGDLVVDGGLEARYEQYRQILKHLTIMSDVFMRNVFKKRECTEYVLRVIMGKEDLVVLDQVLQKDYKNLQGRSAIMDCVARDGTGGGLMWRFSRTMKGLRLKGQDTTVA